jgi:hypothetical protein
VPTVKPHLYFCGAKSWDIQRCLRDGKCPLDRLDKGTSDGTNWHTVHNPEHNANLKQWVEDNMPVERPPTRNGCERWLTIALARLEPSFHEFRSQFQDLSENDVRLCWLAHLVADFACFYWCKGKDYWPNHPAESTYGQIKDPEFWVFVTDVGNRILAGYR